jgi:hypothetical protein
MERVNICIDKMQMEALRGKYGLPGDMFDADTFCSDCENARAV